MKKLIKHLSYKLMVLIGRYVIFRLRKKSKEGNRISYKTLMNLLYKNRNTEYGKKYDFANIHSYEDYKKKVPISDYSDYD